MGILANILEHLVLLPEMMRKLEAVHDRLARLEHILRAHGGLLVSLDEPAKYTVRDDMKK
jgi:hypothetical protein